MLSYSSHTNHLPPSFLHVAVALLSIRPSLFGALCGVFCYYCYYLLLLLLLVAFSYLSLSLLSFYSRTFDSPLALHIIDIRYRYQI